MNEFKFPKSFEELKALAEKFEALLPEENRTVIKKIIYEIESKGENKEKLEQLMQKIATSMGIQP
ncbi:MAG: hypothetical protein PWQ67_859 [Clostridia bacterium]|nr:hypothetical protein [Clostridia bacterium]MDN5322405.1 hypothetical protein [Clostridia bacterium]